MRKDNGTDFEIQEIFKILMKRFYILFIVIIPMVLLMNYYYTSRIKPYYTSRIGLIIGNTINSDQAYDIQMVGDYERFMDTYCALAKTSIVAENASRRLNNSISPEAIQNSIVPNAEANTQFLYIGLTWDNPQQIKQILTAVSDGFIEEAKKLYPTCNINVIESIKDPYVIMPSKKKYLTMGLLGGFVLAVLIVFALEMLNNKVNNEDDVNEYLGIPLLTQVPFSKKSIEINNEKVKGNLNHGILEAFRTLRTNIDFAASSKNIKSIAVTSSKPSEGKSTTAAMLGVAMANASKRTILIDCDLRNPRLHKMFNISNAQGLTNFLSVGSKLKDIIYKSDIENLYIMPAGVIPPNPPELLSSERLKLFIEVLEDKFDMVIFDTPPIGLVTDAQIMCQYADGCVFVVSCGESVKEEASKAVRSIEMVDGRLLGAVLNKVKKIGVYNKYSYYYFADAEKTKGFRRRKSKLLRNNEVNTKI